MAAMRQHTSTFVSGYVPSRRPGRLIKPHRPIVNQLLFAAAAALCRATSLCTTETALLMPGQEDGESVLTALDLDLAKAKAEMTAWLASTSNDECALTSPLRYMQKMLRVAS